ncbi:MAG TPA: AAA family ATPase, partial [Polyangiales bacterium]|nr:AAA family ATPase [Polyangiales bacterium]
LLLRAGTPVALEPKVFDCIELLVKQAGRLTTVERLRAELWPDVHVGPGALRRIINEARKALGDRGDAQALIRTRKGLGYVFTADVERDGALASTPPAPPATISAASSWPFVGRSHELGLLRERLSAGQGGLCLIAGEAGAGKSTLLAALRKSSANGRWLSGQCAAPEGLPAFWPFRELAEQIAKDAELRARLLPLQPAERRALRVAPELAGARATGSRAGAVSAEERFEACAAFAKLLCRLSSTGPLFIAIEDVHWADDGSVLLLETIARAAREYPIVLFASYRPEAVAVGKPLSALLARASGRDGVATVELQPLTLDDLRELLGEVRHPGTGPGAAGVLQQLTAGNALLVHELVSHALATDAAFDAELPASLPHIVAQRVSALPAATQRLLGLCAVLGRDFSSSLLAGAAGTAVDAVLDQLEPALRAGLLRRGDDDPEQLHFTHGLLGDALQAGLAGQLKQAHHRDALRAWKRMPDGPARSGALAVHAFFAGASVPAAERRELCKRAGREAFEALAFDRAALHLGRAVRLLEDGDDSRQAAELTLSWAKARWHADDPMGEVERAFMQAAERARRASMPALFAEAAIGYAVGGESTLYFRSASRRPDALSLVQEAFELLTSSDDPELEELRHRVAATACWMRGEAGELADFRKAAQLALRFAPKSAGPFRQLSIMALRSVAEPERVATTDAQFLAQIKRPGLSVRQRIEAYVLWMAVCLNRGDLMGYESTALEIERLAEQIPQPARFGRLGERLSAYVAIPLCSRVTAATVRGDFARAELALMAMAEHGQRLGIARTPEGDNNLFYMLLQLLGYQGRSAELEPLLDQHLRTSPSDQWRAAVAKAQFALERGDVEAARACYRPLRESGFRPIAGGELQLVKPETLVRIADVCSAVGDAEDAAVLYEKLLPRASFYAHDGPLVCLGSYSRPLAELALQRTRHAQAEQHFADALASNERLGHRPEHVRTRLGLARLLLATSRVQEAQRLIADAAAEARALSMPPMIALADRLASGWARTG